jgi:hypothetical protein
MKKATCVLWAVTGFMFLILCGCGGGGSDSGSTSGSLKVANNSLSGLSVAMVQITPASSNAWGDNQLNQAILSGSSLTFNGIAPGAYNILVTLEDGQELQWDNLEVFDGEISDAEVSSVYKAAGKTIANPDTPATNVNFTYIPAKGNEGATK